MDFGHTPLKAELQYNSDGRGRGVATRVNTIALQRSRFNNL